MTKYELTRKQLKELTEKGHVSITRNGKQVRVTPSMVKEGQPRAKLVQSRKMPIGMQVVKISEYISNHGVDPEMFDVESYVDKSLNYSENLANIKSILKLSTRNRTYGLEPGNKYSRKREQNEFYQIGASDRDIDKIHSAQPPGDRHVKHKRPDGSTYYTKYVERRKNRSDYPGRAV